MCLFTCNPRYEIHADDFPGIQDYICNWFGGEAVSLTAEYPGASSFRSAGYAPFVVDGVEHGASRQSGNFSFTRVYDAGHEVPYYKPKAALALFRRVLGGFAVDDGVVRVTPVYKTTGTPTARYRQAFYF